MTAADPKPARVVVVGSVNMDLVLRCERLPAPGQTVHGRDFRTWPGGKGANQAVAAARLGAAVSFIGCVGDDDFGRSARASLAADGMDLAHLHALVGQATGVALITVDDAAENTIALAGGANDALGAAHLDAAQAVIAGAGLLVCQLETPLATVSQAVAMARAAGVPVLLNPAPGRALPAELLRQVDVLVPNEGEAALLLGLAPGSLPDPAEAARRLQALGPATVILTLGARGACVADADGVRLHAAPRVAPVDTTGAGDTFVGAFAAARCEGCGIDDAIAFAQRAAALAVTREGAMPAMPRRSELEPA